LLLKTRNWTFSIRCGILSPTYFDIDKMFMVICSFIIIINIVVNDIHVIE
jgi:hypothetical protein